MAALGITCVGSPAQGLSKQALMGRSEAGQGSTQGWRPHPERCEGHQRHAARLLEAEGLRHPRQLPVGHGHVPGIRACEAECNDGTRSLRQHLDRGPHTERTDLNVALRGAGHGSTGFD